MKTIFPTFLLLAALLSPLAVRPAVAQAIYPNMTASSSIATNQWVARSGTARVHDIYVQSTSASDIWLHVFDSATNQLDGARSTIPAVKIIAGEGGGYVWHQGRPFKQGVYVATSTTDQTLTNTTPSFKVEVVYRDNN
jgi:hypothetical protein